VNVADAITLTVEPSGHLERGDTVTITCEIRYGAPETPLSDEQEPALTLTLDNEPSFPDGQLFYEPTVNTDNFHRKKLVIFSRLSWFLSTKHTTRCWDDCIMYICDKTTERIPIV